MEQINKDALLLEDGNYMMLEEGVFPLLTAKEVPELSRDMSAHIDSKKVETYIRESENIDIKSALGDALFLAIKNNPEKYADLLNGGTYKDCGGNTATFVGLKTALAYYTYARVVKNGDGNVTRFGFMNKDSEYSNKSDVREKTMAYNEAFSIADTYLKECLNYIVANRDKYPEYRKNGGIKANRTKFKVIGD